MQISISIEPYLTLGKQKLTQYIEDILQISREFQQKGQKICLHFDYFRPNVDIFHLVQSYTNQIDIDLHLMQEPAPSVDGFRSVSFNAVDCLNQNPILSSNLQAVKQSQRGIFLDLGCDFNRYQDLIRSVNYVIIMTVKCGKSGQTFQPSALNLVAQVRRLNPNVTIIIDGGVNENNVEQLKNAGIDVAVVGNYAKNCYENGNLAIGINRLLHK